MTKPTLKTLVILSLIILVLAACGPDADATPQPTRTPLPRFEQVATSTEPPMNITSVPTESAGEAAAVELDPTAVARGEGRWEALECASCHGENGEGGVGSIGDTPAASLIGMTKTEEEFVDWLRTGGDYGSDHLFSTDRLSDSGGRNLYQYVLSLSE